MTSAPNLGNVTPAGFAWEPGGCVEDPMTDMTGAVRAAPDVARWAWWADLSERATGERTV
jgi:hypothetical protein